MTKEERSFVESMLQAGDPGQEGSFGDDTSYGTEAQKTVKINQLSFNENGKKKTQMRPPTNAAPPWCSVQLLRAAEQHVSISSDSLAGTA